MCFYCLCFCSHIQEITTETNVKNFPPMFSSRSFKISVLSFGPCCFVSPFWPPPCVFFNAFHPKHIIAGQYNMFDKSKDNFLSFEFCLILSLPLLASKVYLCGRNSRLSINRRVCPLEINVMKSLKKANIYFIQNYLLSNALILFLIFTF